MKSCWLKRGLVFASSAAKVTASSWITQRFMGDVLLALRTFAMSWKSLRVIFLFLLDCFYKYYLIEMPVCQAKSNKINKITVFYSLMISAS